MNKQSVKKYELIAQRILEQIDTGILKEGELIPTVRELAEIYDVSPQTANKATAHLVGLGILSSRQGSGSVVQKKSEKKENGCIPMLIDRARASYIQGVNSAMGYHGKEIYLAYLNAMETSNEAAHLIIYDKGAETIADPSAFEHAKGFIIQGTLPPCYLDYIREHDIPAVVLNKAVKQANLGRIGSVFMDYHGLEQLCIYLASLGHKKIIYAFSREFEITEVYEHRLQIIRDSFSKVTSGSDLYPFAFLKDDASDAETLRELYNSGYSAMVCYNDITALRAYDLLHQLQIRIPEEMSVTGFDDLFMAEIAAPPLTTVRIDRTQFLHDAMSLLQELMLTKEPAYPKRSTRTDLILRRSCWKSST
ncbi:MAG: GntR family transcriptional regulator [Sphaerochaeta sp.]|nr:GntR family transcriptional regulator [Sphaerochaeta sp.]